jgi:hypothetical protein
VRGYATLCVALVRYLKSIISTTTLKSEHIIAKVSRSQLNIHNRRTWGDRSCTIV